MFYIYQLINNGWELILPAFASLEEAKAKIAELSIDLGTYRVELKTESESSIVYQNKEAV